MDVDGLECAFSFMHLHATEVEICNARVQMIQIGLQSDQLAKLLYSCSKTHNKQVDTVGGQHPGN